MVTLQNPPPVVEKNGIIVQATKSGHKIYVTFNEELRKAVKRGLPKCLFFTYNDAEQMIFYALEGHSLGMEDRPGILPKKLRRSVPEDLFLAMYRRKLIKVDTEKMGGRLAPPVNNGGRGLFEFERYWKVVTHKHAIILTRFGERVLDAVRQFLLESHPTHEHGTTATSFLQKEPLTEDQITQLRVDAAVWGFRLEFYDSGCGPHVTTIFDDHTYWLRDYYRFEEHIPDILGIDFWSDQ